MSAPARRPATYDDVLAAPDHLTAEILAGELHVSPRPAVPHQLLAIGLSAGLYGRYHRSGGGRPGGWVILPEVELHLGEPDPRTVVAVPDLSGWRRERMPQPPSTPAVSLRPDWVCEILSPGPANVRRDRVLKTAAYHRAGIPWMWIVDPLARTIEVLKRQDAGYLIAASHSGDVEVTVPPFDAEPLDLGAWWPEGDEDDGEVTD